MKVKVIKGVSHSIELIHGEISVCITTDEAENLIAQLRAVVPVLEDIQEAAEKWATTTHFEWPNQVPAGKKGFIAGMLAERERMMKDAVDGEVVSDLKNVNYVRTMSKIPDTLYFGEKVSVIIIKK